MGSCACLPVSSLSLSFCTTEVREDTKHKSFTTCSAQFAHCVENNQLLLHILHGEACALMYIGQRIHSLYVYMFICESLCTYVHCVEYTQSVVHSLHVEVCALMYIVQGIHNLQCTVYMWKLVYICTLCREYTTFSAQFECGSLCTYVHCIDKNQPLVHSFNMEACVHMYNVWRIHAGQL